VPPASELSIANQDRDAIAAQKSYSLQSVIFPETLAGQVWENALAAFFFLTFINFQPKEPGHFLVRIR
jgi:hypothetical protein